ncbi:MAG: hypothetical protein K5891_11255 [Lachnospiraceae bacterium]|nr:hypothetical protein [Lachnospiraceae bacterium]
MSKTDITIKSYPSGLRIIFDPEATYEDILEAVTEKFTAGREVFGDSSVVISLVGRTLPDMQEHELVARIEDCSQLHVICIVGEDEETEKHYLHIMGDYEKRIDPREKCRIYHGDVMNHSELTLEENVVILGNVNSGSSVRSKGSILVLGSLLGSAYAGGATNESAFIAALEFQPESLEIGGVLYQAPDKSRFGLRPKNLCKMAYVENGMILTEEMNRTTIEKLYEL